MNNLTSIYELSYLDNDIPFYIGKSKTPKKRKNSHNKTYGKCFKMNIIDEIPTSEWKFWEKHYVSLYKNWGFELLNKNPGGCGPTSWTEEQKENQRNIFKNSNHSQYYTQEVKDKMSESLLGIKRPGVSKALKGKPSHFEGFNHTQESKDKKSKAMLGKIIHTKSSKRNISKGMKKQWETNSNLKNRIMPKEQIIKRIPILQYDLEGNFINEWKGLGFAASSLEINKRGICNCCLGISKTSGGFIWKYKNE